MSWTALLAWAAVGCGRAGFDPISDASPACAPSYELANGSSRYRRGADLSWTEAEADCEADGGHLVVIDDAAENAFVRAQAAGSLLWIGLSDHLTEGTMRWVTGEPVTFEDFETGQPNNNLGTEDCVVLTDDEWNDTECRRDFAYLCECDGRPVAATSCDTDSATDCGECGTVCPIGSSCLDQVCAGGGG